MTSCGLKNDNNSNNYNKDHFFSLIYFLLISKVTKTENSFSSIVAHFIWQHFQL